MTTAQDQCVLGSELAAGEPHHQQAGVVLLFSARDGWSSGGEE